MLTRLRGNFDSAVYAELEAALGEVCSLHIGPFLAGSPQPADVALRLSVIRAIPARARFVDALVRVLDPASLTDAIRQSSEWAASLVESDGWRLGRSSESLREGVRAYADLVEEFARASDATQDLHWSPTATEHLWVAGTTTDFCLTAAMLVLDGTVPLDDVDDARLDRVCRSVSESVRVSRSLLECARRPAPAARQQLAALAGSWEPDARDDELLREIYASRDVE